MVQRIRPNWAVQSARPASGGYHSVQHLTVETATGSQQCVLKATPDDCDPVCDDEARLLALLDARSEAAVPALHGVVDRDDSLPAPFFLAEEVAGRNYSRPDVGSLAPATLGRAAHSLGCELAAVHDVSRGPGAVNLGGYGFVDVEHRTQLNGTAPEVEPAQVVVPDAVDSWPEYLRESAGDALDGLEETRFAALTDRVERSLAARIDALEGPFVPALCRVDHSIENAVFDPETGAVTALLDWEFCVAATPAYDLAFAVDSFSGGLWALVPEVTVDRERVENALLEGYRAAGPDRIVEQYRENGACYRLLSDLHAMLNFESWFDRAAATDQQRADAADPLRARVRSRC